MYKGNWGEVSIFKLISLIMMAGIVLVFTTSARQRSRSEKRELEKPLFVEVSVDKLRAKPRDTITVTVVVKTKKALYPLKVNAILFEPTKGTKNIGLRVKNKDHGIYQGKIKLNQDAPKGLYAITIDVTGGLYKAIGKASFLVGKVIGDFLIVNTFPRENTEEDITHYMKNFLSLGGNMLIIHAIISEKAWYPSKNKKGSFNRRATSERRR